MTTRTGLAIFAMMAASTCIATSAHAQATADTFKAKCAMCHGTDGLASTPAGKAMKAPPVTDPAFIGASDAELFAITKNGKNKMPAFAGKLTPAQMTSLLAYVHTLQK